MRKADMQEPPRTGAAESAVDWPSRQWWLAVLAISLLAMALRLYFITTAVVDHPIRGDATQYVTAAWNLIHRHVFSIAPPGNSVIQGDSYRDPGFPVFLAFWLSIFGGTGPWYEGTLVAQAMLGAATVPLIMISARHWMPDSWLVGAGLLMAVWPHSVTICDYLLSETLLGFLYAFALFFLSIAIKMRRDRWIAVSGLCFGLGALTNTVLLPFAPLSATLLFTLRRISLRTALVLSLCGLALPMAWQIRNAQLATNGADASNRALLNLVQGSWPEYHSNWRARIFDHVPDRGDVQAKISLEYSALQKSIGHGLMMMVRRMAQEPARYMTWYLSKPGLLWGWNIEIGQGDIYVNPTLNSPFVFNALMRWLAAICQAVNPIIALLALYGCIQSIRNSRYISIVAPIVSLLALYITLVYCSLQAEPRYSIPFRGIEMLLASYALWQVSARMNRHLASGRVKTIPQV